MGTSERARASWREHVSTATSLVAFVVSGFTLWETSLKVPDLRIFVPPVIQYSSPYQNSNFEMIAIPVTFANEGARTAVALSMELTVTDPRTKESKRFYSADLGSWSMERTRNRAYQPFAPMPIAGRTTRTENVLFYTRGEAEKPAQIIREVGPYQFRITVEDAPVGDPGILDRLFARRPVAVGFERELRHYDARAFQNGTLPLLARDWRSNSSTSASSP